MTNVPRSSKTTAIRLAPDDELQLQRLLTYPKIRTKADAVRYALRTLKECWSIQLRGDRLEVHSLADRQFRFVFILTPIANACEGKKSGGYDYVLQLRLTPHDMDLIAWLRERGVARTDSAIVRSAIEVLYNLHCWNETGLALFSKRGSLLSPVDLSIFEATFSPRAIGDDQATQHEAASSQAGEEMTLEDIKILHFVYHWETILIKIETLYDTTDFLHVVEKHLTHGTKLYYVVYDEGVLDPLLKQLATHKHRLDANKHLALFWRDNVRIIKVPREEFKHDEFVVFNFMSDGTIGFRWDPEKKVGTLAPAEELRNLAREFIGFAREADDLYQKERERLPENRAVVIYTAA